MMGAMTTFHITLYGIPNCDTVKKARAWFHDQGLDCDFHDFKKHGVPTDRLATWAAAVGWQKLLNRQGTTWRKLDPAAQESVVDERSAIAVMQANSSTIKRPVVEWREATGSGVGGIAHVSVGFAPEQWLAWRDVGASA
jgi:Spx/MgsR family transcriptional regulator